MPVAYDPILVLASILVASMASFTGLRLTMGLGALAPIQRKFQIARAALVFGGGIWSMHFIGMLAVELPVAVHYAALPTLGSMLIAVLITGFGLYFLHDSCPQRQRTLFAGAFTGIGIVCMHYVGMAAIGGNCIVSYSWWGFVLSTSIAISASILAFRLAFRNRNFLQISLGAIVLGITIGAMHYSAMLATNFMPTADILQIAEPALTNNTLALIVAFAAFLVCGFFLFSALPFEDTSEVAHKSEIETQAMEAATVPTPANDDQDVSPLPPTPDCGLRLPYEQQNRTYFVDIDQISSIKAEGRYARLYDGTQSFFCPWSISKIESVLEGHSFMRTHRSHLLNLRRAHGFQRKKDKAFVVVKGQPEALVPVSRTHIAEVRKALGV